MTSSPRRGYLILLALIVGAIFATVSVALIGYVVSSNQLGTATVMRTQAQATIEGALDLVVDKLNQNPLYTGETDTPLGDGTFSATITSLNSKQKRAVITAHVPNSSSPAATKKISAVIGVNDAVISFRYGIQSGQGGFRLENTSSVIGNVYSSGPIVGLSQNEIHGDVISAGPSGYAAGIHAVGGSIYAHTLGDLNEVLTTADKDGYYVTTANAIITGTAHPGSVDQPIAPLPISDAQITDWENQAAAGGSVTCSGGQYKISSGSVTLGPKKIPCDLEVSNSAKLYVSGHLWVTGNIVIKNSAEIHVAASLGGKNAAIIADNPSNRLTSSTIKVQNTASFYDSGTAGSYMFLISQNNSAENGGSVNAIELVNSADALIAYAAHGLVPLANSINLKEVTAYKIRMQNSAVVTYDSGLPSAVFESGPGGSWSFTPGTYAEF